MTKTGKLALFFAVSFAALSASANVFAANRHAVAAGEGQVRQLLLLMDQDQNGQVSRAEFMRFMGESSTPSTLTIAANSTLKSCRAAAFGSRARDKFFNFCV